MIAIDSAIDIIAGINAARDWPDLLVRFETLLARFDAIGFGVTGFPISGTPQSVITTDWGVFTETVQHGVNGFRCRSFADFLDAALRAPTLDRAAIRRDAIARYCLATVGGLYESYFSRLLAAQSGER